MKGLRLEIPEELVASAKIPRAQHGVAQPLDESDYREAGATHSPGACGLRRGVPAGGV